MIAILERPIETVEEEADWIVHVSCRCTPTLALCGRDVDEDWVEVPDDRLCIICYELEFDDCPKCGR